MINEDKENGSWPAVLIDLNLAVKQQREQPSEPEERPVQGHLWLLDFC
jgi:hypothetical protein